MRAETKFGILLIIIFLLCLMGALSSCSCNTCTDTEEVQRNYEYVNYEPTPGVTYSVRALKFEYDGHQYIMFGEGRTRGFVHDPDCPCNNHY